LPTFISNCAIPVLIGPHFYDLEFHFIISVLPGGTPNPRLHQTPSGVTRGIRKALGGANPPPKFFFFFLGLQYHKAILVAAERIAISCQLFCCRAIRIYGASPILVLGWGRTHKAKTRKLLETSGLWFFNKFANAGLMVCWVS